MHMYIWEREGNSIPICMHIYAIYTYLHIYTFIHFVNMQMPRMTMNSWLLIYTSRVCVLSLFLSEVMNHVSEFSIFQISKVEICDKWNSLVGGGACTQTCWPGYNPCIQQSWVGQNQFLRVFLWPSFAHHSTDMPMLTHTYTQNKYISKGKIIKAQLYLCNLVT